MDNVTLWVVAGYLTIVVAIGLGLKVKKGGVRDFFVAGGQLPWYLVMPFLLGEYIHTTATVGTAEMAHELGVVAVWYFVGTPIGLTALAFGFVKFYASFKGITLGEVFAVLFDQRNRLVSVCFLTVSTSMVLGVACLGLGTILSPLLNISYEMGVWVSAVIIVLLASFGLKGIAAMNIVHVFTIIVSFIAVAVVSLRLVGGPSELLVSLPSDHMNITLLGWPTIGAWIISSASLQIVSTIAVTGMFAARNEQTAKIALLASGVFILVFVVLPIIVGLSAAVLMPDIDSRLALWKMGEQGGTLVSTLVSLGVLAAVISTTPGLLLTVSGIVTRDLFLSIKPCASEKSQMMFSMLMIPCVAFASTAFALTQPSILGLVIKVAQVRVIFAIILVVSIMWRRIHPDAALITTVAGAGTTLVWFFLGSPYKVEPLWPGLAVGVVALLISSLVKKPSRFKGTAGIDKFKPSCEASET